jgi:hypothetical protein
MEQYLQQANLPILYVIVGIILLFVACLCFVFMRKSYVAGLKLGMSKEILNRTITSSVTFTVLPSLSILLGVIALSGSLGLPISWLRLSVIGNLQYETTVASIAATGMGKRLDASILSVDDLVTILLVMTIGICWGCLLSITTLKRYSNKIKQKPTTLTGGHKKSFSSYAMVAMFIGMCATFCGSYVATAITLKQFIPLFTTLISALAMGVFEYFSKRKGVAVLDSFSLAGSMLMGMIGAVLLSLGGIV